MKDKFDNIEELFKDGLDGFESDVDPGIWENISSQVTGGANGPDASSSASSGSGSGAATLSGSIVKMAIVAGTAGVLSVGAYLYMNDADDNSSSNETKVEQLKADLKADDIIIPDVKTTSKEESTIIPEQKKDFVTESNSNDKAKSIEKEPIQVIGTGESEISSTVQATAAGTVVASNTPVKEDEEELIEDVSVNEISSEEKDVEEPAVHPVIEPLIHASIQSGILPLKVQFENRGTQLDDISWQVGEGSEVHDEFVFEHTFEQSGQYWVVLRIKDEHGHVFKDSTLISVEGKWMLSIPNVFSPNGDGFNDELIIKTEYIKSMNCKVMNRNGSTIAFWVGLDNHWDGKDMSGKPVGAGTYFIIVEATDLDGNRIAEKGVVTIF